MNKFFTKMANLKNKYFLSDFSKLSIASFVIVFVLISNQLLIQYYLSLSKSDAYLLNIAGRQRMLSQKISLESFKLFNGDSDNNHLYSLVKEWKSFHFALLNKEKNNNIGKEDYLSIEKRLNSLTNNILEIDSLLENNNIISQNRHKRVESITAVFLENMEVIVKEMAEYSRKKLEFLMYLNFFLSTLTIAIVYIEINFIYRKIYNKNKKKLSSTLTSLEELETKYKELQSIELGLNNSFLVSIADTNDIILDVNDKYCEVTKYSKDELIGKRQSILNSGFHSNEFWKELYEKVLNGSTWRNEIQNIDKDGNKFWVDTVITPIFNLDGSISRLMSIRQDITEKKKIEEKLQLTTSILNEAQAISKVGGWELIIESNQIFWTDEVYKIYELHPTTALSNNFVLSFYHPVYRDIISKLTEEAINHGKDFDEEALFISEEGNLKWVRILGRPVYEGNKIIKLKGIIQDITQNKDKDKLLDSTSHRLALATRIAKVGIWDLDIISNELYWDSQMYNLYSVEPDTFTNKFEFWQKSLHPMDAERTLNEYQATIKENKPFDTQFRILLKDGSIRHIKALAEIVFNEKGDPINIIGTNWDITDIKKNEEQLKASIEIAMKASKAKSEFLANMSHEIRTPLNGVIGFTDILLNTELTDSQEEYLNIVNDSAKTLLDVITDILDFSKIEAGKMDLSITKINLFSLVNKIASLLQFQIQSKHIELLINVDPKHIPQFIWTDEIRIKQILINLLSNALKFTDRGEIELKIEKLNGGLRFSVRDTGIGIDLQDQEKIFQSFDQADNSSTRKYGGTGLGLSISNSILSLMDSKLYLKSKINDGSIFYFDLFVAMDHGNVLEDYPPVDMKNILIVDDNSNNRKILNTMLSYFNIKSTEAESGLKAIEILKKDKNFDLIFMDYHMPLQDGLETVSIIRSENLINNHKTPIVLFHSVIADAKFKNSLKDLEIFYDLNKPIDINKLSECLIYHGSTNRNQSKKINLTEENKNININLLLVEDNEINMKLAKVMIKRSFPSINIITASNGIEALELFKENEINLVISDLQMPELNGYQLTEEIRKIDINGSIPIIALTAGTIKGEKEKCLQIGMNDYISKPIIENNLKAVISKWLKVE
jgi:PAS domain S-box-containing protein